MTNFQLVAAITAIAAMLTGCSRYSAGNLDRELCETLHLGQSYEQTIAVMGQPKHVLPLSGQKGEILIYNLPAMAGLPLFSADKEVEIVVTPSASARSTSSGALFWR
ncbi:hypothetical protein [Marilutibacter maris]|uniref:hypothetical protein n=1 Tax=Marilutibacter maris TaxID=1605891 RepID=UPI000DA98784|nr:hypothetical protein [Lysobacter maris]